MVNNERAVQFAPFASLRGYYDLVGKEEKITCPPRMLSDDEEAKINAIISAVKKGDMLRVVYYNVDFYDTIVGVCRKIDLVNHTLTILSTEICTDDIIYAEIE